MSKNKDIDKIIKKLNLIKDKGKKHDLYILYAQNIRIGQFGISRGTKEKNIPYIHRQLQIDKSVLDDVVSCISGRQEVEENLREKGII